MKFRKNVTKILMVSALLAALPISVSAKEVEKAQIDYVALGDSLAAGITPVNQKGEGYPEYLKARFEKSNYLIVLNNFGVPGYTSDMLVKQIQTTNIQKTIIDSELITIDIGANDVLGALGTNQNPALAIANVKSNLSTILNTIKQLNPKTEVYLMGYYNPFPYPSIEQLASLLPLLDSLNGVIQSTAIANGYTYVQTDKVIAKHYEEYLPNPLNIHLSLEGYQIIAKEFWKAIDSE